MSLARLFAIAALASCPVTLHAQTYVGRMSAGSSGPPEGNAKGTVVVAVALSDGLVLATDSRLTLTLPNVAQGYYKVASDSATKLFSIGHVAIATYCEAFLLGRSVNSFVAEFEASLKDTKSIDVEETGKRFAEFFGKYYDQETKTKPAGLLTGFIFAGYNKSGTGVLLQVEFPLLRIPKPLPQNTHDKQGAIWFGQTDVIQRLVKGYDPLLGGLPSVTSLNEAQQKQFAQDLAGIEYLIPFNYFMLQDGIDFALTMVQTTVDMQRFSFGTSASMGAIPGVGGTVDVIAVTPNELTWVRRKTLVAK